MTYGDVEVWLHLFCTRHYMVSSSPSVSVPGWMGLIAGLHAEPGHEPGYPASKLFATVAGLSERVDT
jgi:hypothetical protein